MMLITAGRVDKKKKRSLEKCEHFLESKDINNKTIRG